MLMNSLTRLAYIFLALFIITGCDRTDLRKAEEKQWDSGITFHNPSFKPAESLNIITWNEYIPDEVFDKFTEAYGTKIDVTYIHSNEEMYRLLKKNPEKYDLIMPSDYMLVKLKDESMLQKINLDNIPNAVYLDESIRRMKQDFGLKYSVPLFYSSIGIGFNIKYIPGFPRSWAFISNLAKNDYLNYRISLRKDMRVALGVALMSMGFSPNTVNPAEIEAAKNTLIDSIENTGLQLIDNAITKKIVNKEVLLGVIWNGTASEALKQNTNIRFIYPEGDVITTYESGVIPVHSKNLQTGELLLNFLLNDRVIGHISNYNFFSNSNPNSAQYIDIQIKNGPGYIIPEEEFRVYIEDVGENIKLYNAAWEEILAAKPNENLVSLPLPKHGLFQGTNVSSKTAKQLKE
ncbi:MAG: hypothetical protein C0602_06360 [Denitrovibrio sp.]|nr:MAG: hypothetical protein C0602_06360 [Denitrovibrio sp.]